MTKWPHNPVILEINTWVWLDDLTREAGRKVTLADVPQAELKRLAGLGLDGLWLMGVWRRSPGGRRVARQHEGLRAECRKALPGCVDDDIVGSPYAVYEYTVDPDLGGDEGLAGLRERLRALGLRLILDFVPNHLAIDHRWLSTHPEWLMQGTAESLLRQPGNYFSFSQNSAPEDGGGGGNPSPPALHSDDRGNRWQVFAHGRDPHFSGWSDTVQIDYRLPGARQAMLDILCQIADRCDGARCDMAMLVTRDVFCQTWGGEFQPPEAEFWPCAVTAAKEVNPEFLLLAEAYWDMEWDLQQQGFDYAYDKRLYDRLLEGDAMAVRLHLQAELAYQQRLARFVENHDERRAAEAFGPARSRAAALVALTVPGLRLLHEGQLDGRRVKLPVQLGRRPPEPAVPEMQTFYDRLLQALRHPVFHDGEWRSLRPLPEWQGNVTDRNVIAHRWMLAGEYRVIAVNLSDQAAQFFLPLDLPELAARHWRLTDLLNGQDYVRAGDEMLSRGLYVDLAPYGYHMLSLSADAPDDRQ